MAEPRSGPASPLNTRASIPLYAQLVQSLLARINSEEMHSGDAFPSESQLSRTYSVSRITVREALRILEDEGVILRRPGKGTFLAKKGQAGPFLMASSIEDLVYGGHQAETRRRYLGRRNVRVGKLIAKRLHLPAGSPAVEFQVLVYTEKHPFGHLTITLPKPLDAHLPKPPLPGRPIILLLLESGKLELGGVDQSIYVASADDRDIRTIEVKGGEAVFVVERVFYDTHDSPIMAAIGRYRTDRFQFHVRLRRAIPSSSRRRGTAWNHPGEASEKN